MHATTDDWRSYPDDTGIDPVLAAALRTFTEYGYHGTSVRMIAGAAGLSVPGLYYHFKSKQELLVTLLKLSNDEIMRRARLALAEGGDAPRTRFMLLVENIILYMTQRAQLAHLGREIRSLEEPYRSEHIARRDELERMVRREVEGGQAAGVFRTTDAHEATRAVWIMCRGVADWYLRDGLRTPKEIAERYVRFALALVGDTKTKAP